MEDEVAAESRYVKFPSYMLPALKVLADGNGRSLNAEIIERLRSSLDGKSPFQIVCEHERSKKPDAQPVPEPHPD